MEGRKILIVEDEATTAHHLRRVLELLGHRVTGVAGRVSQALELLHLERPDLVLLDIKLRGERDGVDLAGRLRAEHHVPFVFLTSQADVATVERAKHTRPYGYLVKPFDEQDIYVTLEMAFAAVATEQAALSTGPAAPSAIEAVAADCLFLRYRKQLVKVLFSELCWISADRNYATLHTSSGKYTTNYSLRYVEERLPKADFLRVHKSFIVALRHVSAFDFESQNVIVEGQKVPVGRAYQAAFMRRLNLLGSE